MKFLLMLLAVIQLAACSSVPQQTPVDDPDSKWQQNQLFNKQINQWQLSGRVAIINGHESWHFDINWQQKDKTYLIDMAGPFGAGHAQLMGSPHGVLLREGNNTETYALNPDDLLLEQTGLTMPISGLRYWVKGLVDENAQVKHQKLNNFGYLAELQQSGWHVKFKRYTDINKHTLPEKIFIDGHNVKVKLIIDQWNLTAH